MKVKLEKLVQLIFLFILCIIALGFMKEVLEQFNSNDTSLKMSEVPIMYYPTITFCFQKDNLTYDVDFNISYNNMVLQGETVQYEPEYSEYAYDENYYGDIPDLRVKFQKVYSHLHEGICYLIKQINEETIKTHGDYVAIHVNFNESIPFESLPMIEMYLTSESNSYGVIFKEWMDGHELGFEFERVILKSISLK